MDQAILFGGCFSGKSADSRGVLTEGVVLTRNPSVSVLSSSLLSSSSSPSYHRTPTHTHIQTHTHAPKYLLGSGARPHPVDGHAHLVTCALATYPPKTSQRHRRTPGSPFRNKVAQLSTVPGKCKNGILKSFQLIIFSFVAEQKLAFKMNFPPDMGNIV